MAIVTITSGDTAVTFRSEAVESVTLYRSQADRLYAERPSVVIAFLSEKDPFGGKMRSLRQLLYDTDAAAEESYAAVAAAMEAVTQ